MNQEVKDQKIIGVPPWSNFDANPPVKVKPQGMPWSNFSPDNLDTETIAKQAISSSQPIKGKQNVVVIKCDMCGIRVSNQSDLEEHGKSCKRS